MSSKASVRSAVRRPIRSTMPSMRSWGQLGAPLSLGGCTPPIHPAIAERYFESDQELLSSQTENIGGKMGFKDWCIVLVLVSSAGFIGMTMAVISPVLPLIIEHFGGAAHGALIGQWILAMPSIGIIIGGPATGWVVERVGTRHVLLSSFAIYGFAGAAGLFIDNPYL